MSHPFARPSTLPFGLPPFADIREEHFRPAFEAGMGEQREEVEAIATCAQAPTFENAVEALERSGRLLARVSATFFNLTSSVSTPGLREIEADLAPTLAAHADAIYLDQRLYERIAAVHADRGALGAEQRRLVERYHTMFQRAGVALPAAQQEELRALNAELSASTTRFHADLLADTQALAVHVTVREDLDGLPDDAVAAARAAAADAELDGWLLTLALPSNQPVLALLRNRDLRRRVFEASVGRGGRGGEHDTRRTLARIVHLRARRAALLGYATHADYVIADETAGSREAALAMLLGLVEPAVKNALAEGEELQDRLRADGESGPLQPWDWAYYSEIVRRERFNLDQAALRPYLELGRVLRDGVFYAASALYGLSLRRREDLVAYLPDVEVYDVTDADGQPLGLLLGDWFARPGKQGGAWMSSFVDQSRLFGERAVVVVNLNVPRPPAGEPALLTPDLVRTLFHEFGHAVHGLLSDVTYPLFSGTNVPRDFVEFPSQVNEMWAWWPSVLSRYAVHHETGEPAPTSLVEGIGAAAAYGQGFATTELLAAAVLDLAWHSRRASDPEVTAADVEAFEADALAAHGLAVAQIPPRYRSTYFSHVFAGGYSAGYYSYLWSEVLDADTVEWFVEQGGLVRSAGDALRAKLLSRGFAVDPMQAYADVHGRGPRIEPLLQRRGLLPV